MVAGGGPVALRKVRLLVRAGANVRLVAPEASVPLRALATSGKIVWRKRRFRPADLAGTRLAFACTDDLAVNAVILESATRRNIPAQSATHPETSAFHVPSSVVRGPVQIAFSTGGASPALARRIRVEIEQLLPEGFERYVRLLERVRRWQLGRGLAQEQNAAAFRALVSRRLEKEVIGRRRTGAARILRSALGPSAPVDRLLKGLC